MRSSAGRLEINYFMNRRSAAATMTTQQPLRGEAEIELHEPAEVLIRVPGWLALDQLEFSAEVGTLPEPSLQDPAGRYVSFGMLARGTRIRVRFPLEEKITRERFASRSYWFRWRGNYLIQMAPREALIPFFDAVGS